MKTIITSLNNQREGAASNAHVGREFEALAQRVFLSREIKLVPNLKILVGIDNCKKSHAFDLGSAAQKIIVECKSHKWTSGSNIPNAKLTVWNEAMYYFFLAPADYRKILFVLKDRRKTTGETLAKYYVRVYRHLIPEDVEIWEYDEDTRQVDKLIIERAP